jgi:signal transduction histidine kinase
MVEGVLEYSSADSKLRRTPVDVAATFQDCAARWGQRAAEKGIALTFNLAPGLPPLQADPQQFDKLLRRLIDNALKFTPYGGQVTVMARLVSTADLPKGESQNAAQTQPSQAAIQISVADTGLGLRPEDCERIFEPFVQLEDSYLKHAEGVGLGLTLARRQAEAHGGRLWAESEGVGKGSRFVLELPIQ